MYLWEMFRADRPKPVAQAGTPSDRLRPQDESRASDGQLHGGESEPRTEEQPRRAVVRTDPISTNKSFILMAFKHRAVRAYLEIGGRLFVWVAFRKNDAAES